MPILLSISRSKGNLVMKFVQLIKYEKYFSSKIMQKFKQGDLLFPDLFLPFKKDSFKVIAGGQHLGFNIFW